MHIWLDCSSGPSAAQKPLGEKTCPPYDHQEALVSAIEFQASLASQKIEPNNSALVAGGQAELLAFDLPHQKCDSNR